MSVPLFLGVGAGLVAGAATRYLGLFVLISSAEAGSGGGSVSATFRRSVTPAATSVSEAGA
ncbi:hypothetical protein Q0Z83_085230 [Actinoplanes sichuanensis]|nr:hypothetical protein Q0Z83_085230 [Actinoplanes sichuanensis]